MRNSTSLTLVGAAIALAVGSQAFAQSNGSTVLLTIDDQTTSTEYILDTGMSATSLSTSPITISTSDASFNTFLQSVNGKSMTSTSDIISYSVLSVTGDTSAACPANTTCTVYFDSTAKPTGAATSAHIIAGYKQVNNWVQAIANPSGGSSEQPSSGIANQWFQGGYAANFASSNDIGKGVGTLQNVGTSEGFYSEVEHLGNVTTAGVLSTLGSFLLSFSSSSSGTLQFTPTSSVPLPAPLLLLLSGLGSLGLIGRRRQTA